MNFFLLSWTAESVEDFSTFWSEVRNREVMVGRTSKTANAEAQLTRVELKPNDKAHPGLNVIKRGDPIRFDLSVEEFGLLSEDSYNGEYLVEVDADGNVVSIHDSERPPKIVEEGPKGHKTLRSDPRGYHEGAKGVGPSYTEGGVFRDCYEREEAFAPLYELVEEFVNS